MDRRSFLRILPSGLLAANAPALSQVPGKPLLLLVGGAPGSVPDLLARALSERLAPGLATPVLVDNRPGAAGSIAMSALVRSAADGQTLALATMSQAVFNSYLFDKLPYDPLRDVEPVASLVTGAMVLAAHPGFVGNSLADFNAEAKARPGRLFIAVPQLGSPPHVIALLLTRSAGVEVNMVPHKSGADALTAVLSGEIPFIVEAPTTIAPLVRAGKLKALAVTGRVREPLLAQTPTLIESGVDVQGEAWFGLLAPAGTPTAAIRRLNQEVNRVLLSPEMREVLAKMSFRAQASSPEEFRQLIRDEHARWGLTIRQAGIKLQ